MSIYKDSALVCSHRKHVDEGSREQRVKNALSRSRATSLKISIG